MSMRNNPGSAYVVELESLIQLFKAKLPSKTKYLTTIEDSHPYEEKFLTKINHLCDKLGIPNVESTFILSTDDESDGSLEFDKWYCTFSTESLYSLTPQDTLIKLQKFNINPEPHNWTQWG